MRKLLLILLLIPFFADAQVWQQNNLEYGHQFKGLKALRAFLLPLAETTAGQGRDTGAVYYRLSDSSILVWTGSQWRQVTGSGAGAVSSVFGRTGAVTALEADYSAFYPLLSGTYNNPSWLNQLAWSKITGTPTTLAGYGITDGLTNITGLVTQGTNVTITGSGTSGSPYVVNASGGGVTDTAYYYDIRKYGADSTGVLDATSAIQAAVDTCANRGGGRVLIPQGTYKVTATITNSKNNVIIEGVGERSKILATGDYGNIFEFIPTTPTSQNQGLNGIQFRNFYIESNVARTSGAAIYAEYSYNLLVTDMRLGTKDLSGTNVAGTNNIYDGVYLKYQSACIINNTQVYPSHYGVYSSGYYTSVTDIGIGSGAVKNFYFDGLITGNCNIWGKRNNGSFVAGSVGVYLNGGNGGFQIEQSNISFFVNGIKADKYNRELFIGHAFSADDCGGAGIYIKDTINIVQVTGGWAAGNGRGTQTPRYNFYVDSNTISVAGGNQPRINIAGGAFHSGDSAGVYLGRGIIALTGVYMYGSAATELTLGGNVSSVTIIGGYITNVKNNSSVKINGGGINSFELSGKTGTRSGVSMEFTNSNTSTNTTFADGNTGIFGSVTGTTAGLNSSFATYSVNAGSGGNVGTFGTAFAGNGTGNRFGVIGRATSASAGSGNWVGGYFEANASFSTSAPTLPEKAALIANNNGVANTSIAIFKTAASTNKIIFNSTGLAGFGNLTPTAQLHTTSFATAIFRTVSSGTLTDAQHTVIITNSSHSLTIPSASGRSGHLYILVNENTGGDVTISSVQLNGSAVTLLPNNAKWTIQSDGTNWIVIQD